MYDLILNNHADETLYALPSTQKLQVARLMTDNLLISLAIDPRLHFPVYGAHVVWTTSDILRPRSESSITCAKLAVCALPVSDV
jgi:hypothetical protein